MKKIMLIASLIAASTAHADALKIKIRNESGHDFYFLEQYGYWFEAPAKIANHSTVEFLGPRLFAEVSDYRLQYYDYIADAGSYSSLAILLHVNNDNKLEYRSFCFLNNTMLPESCQASYNGDNLIALDCELAPR